MKLLKNEIKQVLLEIQEQVLNAQNPFNVQAPAVSVVAAPAARQPAPEPIMQAAPAPQAAPIIIDATTTIGGGGGAQPAPPGGGMMGSVFPAGYQPSAPAPVGADDLRDAGGPSLGPVGGPPEAPPEQPPPSEGSGGSPFGSPLSEPAAIAPIEDVAEEDDGPASAPATDVAPAPAASHEDPQDSSLAAGPPPPEPGLPKSEDQEEDAQNRGDVAVALLEVGRGVFHRGCRSSEKGVDQDVGHHDRQGPEAQVV